MVRDTDVRQSKRRATFASPFPPDHHPHHRPRCAQVLLSKVNLKQKRLAVQEQGLAVREAKVQVRERKAPVVNEALFKLVKSSETPQPREDMLRLRLRHRKSEAM